MIVYKKGNLFDFIHDGKYDIILNFCNCFCKMDDGISLQFAHNFPEVLLADINTVMGDKSKLGTYKYIKIERFEKTFEVFNCYTQFAFTGYDLESTDDFDYEAFEKILQKLSVYSFKNRFCIPLVVSGQNGSDTERFLDLIRQYLSGHKVDIVLYDTQFIPKEYMSYKNKMLEFYQDISNKLKVFLAQF